MTTTTETTEYHTVAELAVMLRVNKQTVYRLIDSGAIQAYRFGRTFRVTPADFATYVKASKVVAQ